MAIHGGVGPKICKRYLVGFAWGVRLEASEYIEKIHSTIGVVVVVGREDTLAKLVILGERHLFIEYCGFSPLIEQKQVKGFEYSEYEVITWGWGFHLHVGTYCCFSSLEMYSEHAY